MKFLGPFYLGLQKFWPIVASQFFSSTSLGLPIFLAQNQEWFFSSLLLWFQILCPTIVASHFFWFHFLGPLTKVGSAVISSLLLGPPIFLAHRWHSSSVFSLTSFLLYCLLFHDFLWIAHGYFMIFYGYFKDFSWNFMDRSWIFHQNFDQQVLVCCKFAANLHPWCAPLMLVWCQFDASLMPVLCDFDASLILVWCHFGASFTSYYGSYCVLNHFPKAISN